VRNALDSPGGPTRTCLGCREKAAKGTLQRIVASEGNLVIDEDQRMPGRGAYTHRNLACVTKAIERKAFNRALRVNGPLDPSALT